MPKTFHDRRAIPEIVVAGKPLGRHINHDPRSADYPFQSDGTVATVRWTRHIPALNQGLVSSCTGNALVGNLATDPDFATLAAKISAGLKLDESEALHVYSAAEMLDGSGPYPPNDVGSSGLSVAKAAKNDGLIDGYTHIFSLAAAKTAIQKGAFITGFNWYTSMDDPDANGLVMVSGTVRGAHEVEVIGFNVATGLWEFYNSWGNWGLSGRFFLRDADYARLLSEDGDATVLSPLAVPVPVPVPNPTPTPKPSPVPPFPYAGTPDYFGPVWGPDQCHSGDPRYDSAACRANIKLIQLRLMALGWAGRVASSWADGIYEEATLLAVQRFQRAKLLTPNGCVRSHDWALLFATQSPRPGCLQRLRRWLGLS